jgi:hypothetical protein
LWYFWLHSVVLVWGLPNFLNFCPIKDFSTLQTFHSRIILRAQFFVYSFLFRNKIYQIYSASKHKQKVELAADTPQSLGIKELSRTHHRTSSFFNSFVFGMKNYQILASQNEKNKKRTELLRWYARESSLISKYWGVSAVNLSFCLCLDSE